MTHNHAKEGYIPALPLRLPSKLYDVVLAAAFPENDVRRQVVDRIDPQPYERILDVACGTGSLLRMLHDAEPKALLTGVDVAADMLTIAQSKLPAQSVVFSRMDASSLKFPNRSYDKVVSTLAFHHFPTASKRRALGEIRRVLKPGGRFVLADFSNPSNVLMRLCFAALRVLDGFENTRAHADGELLSLIQGSFVQVSEVTHLDTVFGTVRIYEAIA